MNSIDCRVSLSTLFGIRSLSTGKDKQQNILFSHLFSLAIIATHLKCLHPNENPSVLFNATTDVLSYFPKAFIDSRTKGLLHRPSRYIVRRQFFQSVRFQLGKLSRGLNLHILEQRPSIHNLLFPPVELQFSCNFSFLSLIKFIIPYTDK